MATAQATSRLAIWSRFFFLCSLAMLGGASNAWAAGASADPFGNAADILWRIGLALVQLGRGGMLVGGGWAILAAWGKIGYFSAAVSVFAGGLFLANLPRFIDFLIPA